MEILREGTITIGPDGSVTVSGFRIRGHSSELLFEARKRVHRAAQRVSDDCSEMARGQRAFSNTIEPT